MLNKHLLDKGMDSALNISLHILQVWSGLGETLPKNEFSQNVSLLLMDDSHVFTIKSKWCKWAQSNYSLPRGTVMTYTLFS